MGFYDRWILPHLIRLACGSKAIGDQREKIVPRAQGVVLEVGIGAGANLAYYDPARVTKVVGVDPSAELRAYAEKAARDVPFEVELVGLGAEEIPLEAGTVDTVVSTYTLCTIPDPVRALRDMRRVLKSGGHLHFSEHGRAPDESVQRWQDRLDGFWGRISGGCHLNREISDLIREAGFETVDLETGYLAGPRFAAFNYWGSAR